MLVRKRKLILNLRDPTKILNLFPQARTLDYQGKRLVVLPHRLTETRLLRNLGFDPPHPMERYYHYPMRAGLSPFDHQRETSQFLALHNRAYCLDDMGLGKTLSVLWAFDYLRSEGLAKKALVVSPMSTMERTWADEVWTHLPHLRAAVAHGSRDFRRQVLKGVWDILIINHDGVKVILDDLVKTDFDLVVIDELSQAARNANTDRWKAYKAVTKGRTTVWGLTGTPTPNAPTDAWAQCKLITPETVPMYHSHFRDQTMRQVTEFKWVPRDDALETVKRAMQPAIRHKRTEVLDLPPTIYESRECPLTKEQSRLYKEMMDKLRAEARGNVITAANEAVKAMKLVQISCIGKGTEVLSHTGWKPIEAVTHTDLLWDGEEWVAHQGLLPRGEKRVINVAGVWMTPDHRVLTTRGWKTAEEMIYADASERLDWADVRLPDGAATGGLDGLERGQVCNVGVSLRLWEGDCEGQPGAAQPLPHQQKALRVQVRDARDNAWKRHPQSVTRWAWVLHLAPHKTSVSQPTRQRLSKLRRTWHRGMRTVARVVRELLGGYGAVAPTWTYAGADGQRWSLLTGKLSVGNSATTKQQHQKHGVGRYSKGAYVVVRRGEGVWTPTGQGVQPHPCARVGCNASVTHTIEVFDIANCGPRHRFVVRGSGGQHLIVHNCGASIAEDGILASPPKHRLLVLRDVIEEAASKTIVYVPFRAPLDLITEILRKGYSVEQIHGGVSKADRDRIFGHFQRSPDPQVLVAQPAAMSHGLTLTAASTIVWFAPVTSAETYEQANARITRPGQKHTQLIVHLQGSPIEALMYKRLKDKTTMQGVLLNMFK